MQSIVDDVVVDTLLQHALQVPEAAERGEQFLRQNSNATAAKSTAIVRDWKTRLIPVDQLRQELACTVQKVELSMRTLLVRSQVMEEAQKSHDLLMVQISHAELCVNEYLGLLEPDDNTFGDITRAVISNASTIPFTEDFVQKRLRELLVEERRRVEACFDAEEKRKIVAGYLKTNSSSVERSA
ncbi:hypothetical protein CC80DRAFT_556532 [Byssothecium circinans]|uniref:Uncharacterized protein n=1 Tax=Byssothecium circinans TaxID=147558 RepID=A0A6A5T5I9_9PLEO|nr:hypothetical protein CC80DRAFT_556557 [Byssothecium circinans]KAF1948236.1 hypothetical protein CC80DRAFT_556532 [Byssothecium circinans]